MRAGRRIRGHGARRGQAGGHLSKRIGVLGGTFDPVHNAHIAAGAAARHQLGLDTVLFVVANAPWQKADRRIAGAQDRYDMVAAALQDVDGLEPSRIEIDRGGTTYTADTLADLRGHAPSASLFLVLGTDVADDLHTWDRIDEIRAQADLAVVTRPGAPSAPVPGWPDERVHRIELPVLEISSTDLRRRAAVGEPVDGLVPPAVVRLLRDRALYAGGG